MKLRMPKNRLIPVIMGILLSTSIYAQDDIIFEDFEDASLTYSTSTPEFSDGSTDFFTRTDGSQISSGYVVTGFNGASFFAAQDVDAEGASAPVSLTFDADITDFTDLNFSVLLAEDDDGSNQDWDVADYVHFDYSIDGAPYTSLLCVRNDGSTFNTAPLIDTDCNGTGDGAEISSLFTEYGISIPETGSSISIRISINLDAGDEDIALDDVRLSGTAPQATGSGNLLISEYVEGSSFNKYIELYNGSGADVDLSEYSIAIYSNGSTSPSFGNPPLTGTLSNESTLVLANAQAALYAGPLTNNSAINFNGNDAVGLFKNGALVDLIGNIGSSANFGADKTFRRKTEICEPNTTYTPAEWDQYGANSIDLGVHLAGCSGGALPPYVDLGEDLSTCPDDPATILNAENEGATYLWSTGETTPTIAVTEWGTYTVTVSTPGGTASDEITLSAGCQCPSPVADAVAYQIDFESEGAYSTSIPEFTDGSTDFFLRTDGTGISSAYQVSNPQGTSYFAAQDIDAEGANIPVQMNFSANVAAYQDLVFKILLAEDDDGSNHDWDPEDYLHIYYSVDGGPIQNLLWVENDGSQYNSPALIDTDFDGTGDGTEITSSFTEFTQSIPETGSTIDFTIEFYLNSGDEDIAIDNIRLEGSPAAPEEIYALGFEQEAGYTTSVSEFSDGAYDFFTRTDGSTNIGSYDVTGQEGNYFFAAQDLDGEGAGLPLFLNIENINISGYSDLGFKVLLAEDDDSSNQDWDANDYVHFDYSIDGGPWLPLLWISGTSTNTAPQIDTDFDGIGDCSEVSNVFQEFVAALEETGSFLNIRIEFQLDAGDEDLAIDLLRIDGVFQGGGEDNTAPEAICAAPGTIILALDESGNAQIDINELDAGSSDNIGIAERLISKADFNCDDLGIQNVTLTIIDLAGNEATCSTEIEVIDALAPVLSVNGLINIDLDEYGNATINAGLINNGSTDNCGLASISASPASLTCADISSETSFAQDLIISEYMEGSSYNKFIEIYNGTGAAVNLADYSLDLYTNGSSSIGASSSLAIAGTLQDGSTAVFKHPSANIYAGASHALSIMNFNGDDAIALVNTTTGNIVDLFGTIGEDPGSQWSVAGSGTRDNTLRRAASVINGTNTNAPGFPELASQWISAGNDNASDLGQHTSEAGGGTEITFTAVDNSGNQSSITVSAIVNDVTAPVFTEMPDDITVYADPATCASNVNWTEPIATDNCSASLESNFTSGSVFPLGTTLVEYLATDPSGNESSATFNVTVLTSPLTAEISIVSPIACNGGSTEIAAMVMGGCQPYSYSWNGTEGTQSQWATAGTQNLLVTDANGNSATAQINLSQPAALAIEINATNPSCPNLSDGSIQAVISGGTPPYTLAWSGDATGTEANLSNLANGNYSLLVSDNNACTATQSILLEGVDLTAPTAVCLDAIIYLDENGMAYINAADIDGGSFDNCGELNLSLSQELFTCSEIGEHTLSLTATDEAGNSTTCEANITVADNTAPIVLTNNVELSLDLTGYAELSAANIDAGSTDNCGIESLAITSGPLQYGCEDEGQTFSVMLTATDINGNSSSAEAFVTIVTAFDEDNDGVSDACDICFGDDATGDTDGDGICDSNDSCPGFDDMADADADCDVSISSIGWWYNASGGQTYCLDGNFNGGQIYVSGGSTLRISGTGNLSVTVAQNSSLEIMEGADITFNYLGLNWGAEGMVVYPGATANFSYFQTGESVVNCGTINATAFQLNYGGSFINNGTLNLTGDYSWNGIHADFVNNGLVNVEGVLNLYHNGNIENNCTMILENEFYVYREVHNYSFIDVQGYTNIFYNGRVHLYDGAMFQTESTVFSGKYIGSGETSLVKVLNNTVASWNGRIQGNIDFCDEDGIELAAGNNLFQGNATESCRIDIPVSACNPVGHNGEAKNASIADNRDKEPFDMSILEGVLSADEINGIMGGESDEKPVSIFPNPTTGNVMVNFTSIDGSDVRVEVYNARGKKLSETNFANTHKGQAYSGHVDISKFENGVYFFRITNSTQTDTKKVVLSK